MRRLVRTPRPSIRPGPAPASIAAATAERRGLSRARSRARASPRSPYTPGIRPSSTWPEIGDSTSPTMAVCTGRCCGAAASPTSSSTLTPLIASTSASTATGSTVRRQAVYRRIAASRSLVVDYDIEAEDHGYIKVALKPNGAGSPPFLAAKFGPNAEWIYTSTDGGDTWTKRQSYDARRPQRRFAEWTSVVAVNPDTEDDLYAGQRFILRHPAPTAAGTGAQWTTGCTPTPRTSCSTRPTRPASISRTTRASTVPTAPAMRGPEARVRRAQHRPALRPRHLPSSRVPGLSHAERRRAASSTAMRGRVEEPRLRSERQTVGRHARGHRRERPADRVLLGAAWHYPPDPVTDRRRGCEHPTARNHGPQRRLAGS